MSSNEPTLPFNSQSDAGDDRTLPFEPERISQLGLETALFIDRLCADFEQACRRDPSCRLEPWLAKCSERERVSALQELLGIEADERKKHGEVFDLDEYRRRFPQHPAVVDRWALQQDKSAETFDASGPACTLPAVDPALVEVREKFGEFEVLAEIGCDGPWLLRKARQTQLNRQVILKTPRPNATSAELETLARALHQEAEVAARLDHPSILPVVGSGEWEGIPYLASGSVDGETLAEVIARGPLDHRLAADYARQLAETLFVVHQAGTRHGNLRPEDIYIGRDGRLRLKGFQAADILPLRVTSYTAPERRPGFSANVDHRIDVYGIGALLYAMLTGEAPYRAADDFALWSLIWKGKLRPPREINRRIDRDLEAICQRCLAPEPYDRYRGRLPTQPLIADLRRYLSGHMVEARPDAAWRAPLLWARRNRRPFVAAAAALVLLVLATGWESWQKHRAWEQLLQKETSASAAEQSRDFFARRGRLRPHCAEFMVGKSLATLRARGAVAVLREYSPDGEQSNYQFAYTSDPDWNQTLIKIQRQIALRLGYFSVATDHLKSSERRSNRHVDQVLSAENSQLMQDGDVLALSVARGDVAAIRAAASVEPTDSLIQALVEEAGSHRNGFGTSHERADSTQDYLSDSIYGRYYHAETQGFARETLAKLAPQLSSSAGAQRAIPGLIERFADTDPGNRPSVEQLLNSIDTFWRKSSHARAAIGPLIVRRATVGNSNNEPPQLRAKFLDGLLNELDPQWMQSSEADAAVAPLSTYLERESRNHSAMGYHAEQSTKQRYEPLWGCIDVVRSLGARGGKLKPTLERMLLQGDLSKMAGAAGLASVDPAWASSQSGKQALSELIESQGQSFGMSVKPTGAQRTVIDRGSIKVRYPTDFAVAMQALVEVDRSAVKEALLCTLPNDAANTALSEIDADWAKSPAVVGSVPRLCELLQQEDEPLRVINISWVLGKLGASASPAQRELIERLPSGEQAVVSIPVSQTLRGQSYEASASVGEVACKTLDFINPQWRTDPANRDAIAAAISEMMQRAASNKSDIATRSATILALIGQQPLILNGGSKAREEVFAGLDSSNDQVRTAAHSIFGGLGWRGAPAIPTLLETASGSTYQTPIARSALQRILLDARKANLTLDEMRPEVGEALDLAQLLPVLTLPRCEARQEAIALMHALDPDWRNAASTTDACRTWKQDLELKFLSPEWNTAAMALHLCNRLPPEAEQAILSGFVGTGDTGDLRPTVRAERLASARQIGEMLLSSPPVLNALLNAIDKNFTAVYDQQVAAAAEDALAAIGAKAFPATLLRVATPDDALRSRYLYTASREVTNLATDDAASRQAVEWCIELADQPLESPALYGLAALGNLRTYSIPPRAIVPAMSKSLEHEGRWRFAARVLSGYGPEAADALPVLLRRALNTTSTKTDDEKLLWETIEKIDPWGPCTPQVAKTWGEQTETAAALLKQCEQSIPPPKSVVSRALDTLTGRKNELDSAKRAEAQSAIRVLGHLRSEGGPAVQLLSDCLHLDGDNRHYSTCSLGQLGPIAKSAVPDLLQAMNNTDSQDYNRVALDCLDLIDPTWATAAEHAQARARLANNCARSLASENTKWRDHLVFAALGHFRQDLSTTERGGGEFVPVDLSPFTTEKFDTRIGDGENHLSQVPRDAFSVNGGQFLISDKYVRLTAAGDTSGIKLTKPILVQKNADRIHFLQVTWGGTNDGLVVGYYRIRYTDETYDLIPLVFNQNISDWWVNKANPRPLPFAKVAWRGTNPQVELSGSALQLSHYTWVNPSPEKTIASFQLVNIPSSTCGCCLVAVSLEQLAR